jgi:Beta-propeller repeat
MWLLAQAHLKEEHVRNSVCLPSHAPRFSERRDAMKIKSHRRACAIGALGILIAAAAVVCAAPGRGFVWQRKVAKAQFAGPSANAKMSPPNSPEKVRLAAAYGKLPLAFEPNQGQTDSRVKFLARSSYTLFLTDNAAVLELPVASDQSKAASKSGEAEKGVVLNSRLKMPISKKAPQIANSVLQMRLLGVNPKATIGGEDELPGKSNYFIGNDPKKWRTAVPNYARVKYSEIYPGVNLVYYGNQSGQLEYDFQVAPGADPSAITFDVAAERGSRDQDKARAKAKPNPSLRLDANGDLLVKFAGGEVRFHKPVVYQPVSGEETGSTQKKFITGRYLLANGNLVRFAIANYDKSKPLIIDPSLVYSCLIGGSGGDRANGVAVDDSGNAYLTGLTYSVDFPAVNQIPGACNGTCGSGADVAFITKINAAGNALAYSSFIGGSGGVYGEGDAGASIAVDGSGNAYVTGSTGSSDFPIVNQIPGACNGFCGTGTTTNAFITKVNASGNALLYSSLIGGSGSPGGYGDGGSGIALDDSDNAYLTGNTVSSDFPVVNQISGACNGTCGTGVQETVFVTKVNAQGTSLVYSSYIGGSGGDGVSSVALDSSRSAYLVGSTESSDFPIMNQIPGACNGICGNKPSGLPTIFIIKINPAGSALVYSSRIGGSNVDEGFDVAVDGSGGAYLTGDTWSNDFPVVNQIPGACNGTCGINNAEGVAFITKVNAAGSTLVYSSLIGGSGNGEDRDVAYGIAVDASGAAYLAGESASTDFPIVDQIPGACNATCGNANSVDAFATKINSEGSALVYSSLIGGGLDGADSIATDASDNSYVTGISQSAYFPRVNQIPGACNGTCGSGSIFGDAFVTKISPADAPFVTLSPASLTFGPQGAQNMNVPQFVTLTNIGQLPLSISSIGVTGQNNGDFTETNNCPLSPATLGVNGSCKIMVVFAPQESGTLNASISVADNAPGSPQSVSLTGVGVSGRPRMGAPTRR